MAQKAADDYAAIARRMAEIEQERQQWIPIEQVPEAIAKRMAELAEIPQETNG